MADTNNGISPTQELNDQLAVLSATASQQYIRKINLIVYGQGLSGTNSSGNPFNGIDLSNLRIKFSVKRSDTMTPNTADIRVYNVETTTALAIFTALNPTTSTPNLGRVILQAGYETNFGVIFQGNIKQIILGRESATDTFVDIIAADGVQAFNFAIVNQTLAAGSTQSDQVFASVQAMAKNGVTAGHDGNDSTIKLPRGKVMYGNAKNYLRNVAQNTQQSWSIQDEKITFVPIKGYLPGEAVVLTSKTGLIGTPQQTNQGVNVKCLLNPLIRISTRIKIDEASIQDFKIDLSVPNSAANIAPALQADGVYYVLVAEHSGDTRGIEWYTSILGINMNVSTPINTVQVGYGP